MKTMLSPALSLPLRFFTFIAASAPMVGPAQENAANPLSGNIQVQTTVFKVAGPGLPLSLLNAPPSEDGALFAKLTGMVAEGSAELLADHHFTTSSSPEYPADTEPSRQDPAGVLQSVRETPFPTEYDPRPKSLEMIPQSFEFKNCGMSTNARLGLFPQGPHRSSAPVTVRGQISVESVRGNQWVPWPVSLPGAKADGSLEFPQFLSEKTQLFFHSEDSRQHLISVGRLAGVTLERNDDYFLTFAKASPADPAPRATPAAGTVSAGMLRLHALTFQLPALKGRELLQERRTQGDPALLAALLDAVTSQEAVLCGQMAILVDGFAGAKVSIPQPDPFVTPDPFAKGAAPPAKLDTIEEFEFSTEWDGFLPQSFELKNLGHSFEVSAAKPTPSGQTKLSIRLEAYLQPRLMAWPESLPGETARPQIRWPAFPWTILASSVTVRPGGVYSLGAITLPSFFENPPATDSQMRISLLKVSGENGISENAGSASSSGLPPEVQSEVISLSPQDAAVLKGLDHLPAEAEALLLRLTESGAARSISWAQVAGDVAEDSDLNLSAGVETPIPTGCRRSDSGHLLPQSFDFQNLQTSLEIRRSDKTQSRETKERILEFMHANASLIQPGTDQLKDAADGKKKLDTDTKRFEIRVNEPLSETRFQILSLAPANVPPGHPEEGRWHVAVMRIIKP